MRENINWTSFIRKSILIGFLIVLILSSYFLFKKFNLLDKGVDISNKDINPNEEMMSFEKEIVIENDRKKGSHMEIIKDEDKKVSFESFESLENQKSYSDKDDVDELASRYLANEDELFIEVYKDKRILRLYKGSQIVEEFKVALGFSPIGHKKIEGDGKTPEGEYYICVRNSESKFYLSLGLSYPNIEDARFGLEEGLIEADEFDNIKKAIENKEIPNWYSPLGGEIMIHGHGSQGDWTEGCIAIDNDEMDILWDYCNLGLKVFIYP